MRPLLVGLVRPVRLVGRFGLVGVDDWKGGENKKRLKIIRFPVFWGAQERTIISVFKNGLLLVNNLIHKLLVLYQKC